MFAHPHSALPLLLVLCSSALAGPLDLVLNDYGTDYVLATSLDQPRMTAVVFDGNSVIRDANQAVVMDAFVDTGASAAAVISHLNAVGYSGGQWPFETYVPSLGLDGSPAGEFLGPYTETGIGGQETGDVTRPLGLRLVNQPLGTVTAENYAGYAGQFVDYGQHGLWVRRQVGAGEIVDIQGIEMVDPVNIIGMPVIQQRVMVMDPRPLADGSLMETRLLPAGNAGIPPTDLSFRVLMQDFSPPLPPGEVRPSVAANPIVPRIGLSHTPEGTVTTHQVTDQQWLFDTGAGSSFVSLQTAWDLGLVPDGMGLATFLPLHQAGGGIVMPVGGIGPAVDVPVVTVDEIRLPALNTHDVVVWRNVDILILDIAGLDGVFGMNLLLPSATIDPADPIGSLGNISPGYFDDIAFDAAGGELRVNVGFELPAIAADFNGDRKVNGRDFLIWQANYPMAAGALHDNGDATGDGAVNGRDFLIWQSSYQPAFPPNPVPAPAALALLLGGLPAILARKRTGGNPPHPV